MKKIKKIITVFSAIAAISLSALPVSAFYPNPIEENCDIDNILLHSGYGDINDVCFFPDGMALAECNLYKQYILTPEKGVTLTAELLGIPDKYPLETDSSNEVRLPAYTNKYEDRKILDELAVYVRRGMRKGYISKAETEETITGKCIDEPRLAIDLKEGTDINEFIADYPEYELTADNSDVPDKYKNYQLFSRVGQKEEVLDFSDKGFRDYIGLDMVRIKKYGNAPENRRVKSRVFFGKTCDEIHSMSRRVTFWDEYALVDNPDNIAWKFDDFDAAVYKNGRVYSGLRKHFYIKFTHNNGSCQGLPDKYKVTAPYKDNFKIIEVSDEEELNEAAGIVKDWQEKGIAENAEIIRYYTHSCGTAVLNIELKNADDFEAFKADYPEYNIERYWYDDIPEKVILYGDDIITCIPEIGEKIKSDSRVKNVSTGCTLCEVIHTVMDDPQPIDEYIIPDTKTNIKGDLSGNGKIDIYDAIKIAEAIVSGKTFAENEISAADYNDDGKIDIYDAIGIAEYIIKNK